jgi:hypothetical protein
MLQGTTADLKPQRLAALQLANEIRSRRAKLRRQLSLGTMSAAEVLLDPPSEAASWSIAALLMSQRRWGPAKCKKLLARNQINHAKALRDLTSRQRRMLVDQLQPVRGASEPFDLSPQPGPDRSAPASRGSADPPT